MLATRSAPQRSTEQTKFWRDPALRMELLRATYITHSFARHTHEGYAIGVIDAGVEEFAYQGATHQATANNIVIVHPGEVHTGHAGVPDGWKYRMFYPSVALLQGELSRSVPYFPQPVIQDQELAEELRRLHLALESADSRLEADCRFLWTFSKLLSRYAEHRPQTFGSGLETLAVRQALDYLSVHYAHAVSLNDLANIAQLKPLRFLRVFQRATGLPPHSYLVQMRVEQAKKLLAAGLPIAQAAFDTGFTDQSHLNRHFKRLVGVTPGQYVQGCKA
ncbi:MAG: AraC family transcriptional regulator [Pegethrix bostrychoides GSE-TBD4-15B]|uniref:AraC family transcriptional regulator n=1 Tax=Pegethrix bostrychoides GSE-TBD4-15B TaxID=2839662 RepID=A0A951PA08_9CYAN|nr:AraC family transcriptional regulator [Pegethrix bostrychoides GSE-TBD4-15B]